MYRWVPTIGEFQVSENKVVFKGGSSPAADPKSPPTFFAGVALADQVMVNGELSATVSFKAVNTASTCELIVGYDPKTQSHVAAGLGGGTGFFSIREWIVQRMFENPDGAPQATWNNLRIGGDRRNLKAKESYDLKARVEGSLVRLWINGVQIAETNLSLNASSPRQVGVFCLGEADITITDFSVKTSRPKAFIVMQFSSPYNDVYSNVIKEVCESFKIEAVRGDEIYGDGIIIKDVINQIETSQVVIADISPANPNVYFEVGYALALGKPIILLAQTRDPGSPLPFDLSAFRVLFYDNSIGGKPKLEGGLRNHLSEILRRE